MSLVVRGGWLLGPRGARRLDLRAGAAGIDEVAPACTAAPDDEVLDAGGLLVVPGLHDHHVHLRSAAAALESVDVGPAAVTGWDGLVVALRGAAARSPGAFVRAVGYHDSVAGPLDCVRLDEALPGAPVRVQHRSGALWVLNSAGLAELGPLDGAPPGLERDPSGEPTGRLYRLDGWLRTRVPRVADGLGRLSAAAAARGVTGFTEATVDLDQAAVDALGDAVGRGEVLQRLAVMAPPAVRVPDGPRLCRGPVKVVLDDPDLPTPEELATSVAEAHGAGHPVAVHCVTAVQLVVTLAALDLAGPLRGDRLEHASVVPASLVAEVARLGLVVVTNPGFVAERGDEYLAEVDPADLGDLYRLASLEAGGVAVAAGTDAPFGSGDPWVALRAARRRRTRTGAVLGAAEALDAARSLALLTGSAGAPGVARRLEPGQPADLCLLRPTSGDGPPLLGDVLDRGEVAATVVAGRVVVDAR